MKRLSIIFLVAVAISAYMLCIPGFSKTPQFINDNNNKILSNILKNEKTTSLKNLPPVVQKRISQLKKAEYKELRTKLAIR